MSTRQGRIRGLLVLGSLLGSGLLANPSLPASGGVLASEPPSSQPSAVERLKGLVEAAEKALEGGDVETADRKAEEADTLVDAWPVDVLRRADVASLVERLRVLRRRLDALDAPPEVVETVTLTPDETEAERARVRSVEGSAHYDFPIDLNAMVLAWVHAFTNEKRGFMEGSLSRATQFLPMVQQVFEEEGLPRDLAYLAVVESGFKNHATSRAKAVGMWQFIKSTGRLYGLKGNAWVEERRDPVKATRAAARYLKRLYESTGDWYLALAGYNAGPLTVERAAEALGSRNYWDMARSRYLRNETKHYVPQLCAAILIGRHPERYGLTVVPLPPYAFETVEVRRATRLSVLARATGISEATLKELNPELLKGTTPPGHYTLKVPPGLGPTVQRTLAGISSREQGGVRTYVVRRGDTLAKVASRFKVRPETLLEVNGLTRAGFRKGIRLEIPEPEPVTKSLDEVPLEPLPSTPAVGPALPTVVSEEPTPKASDVLPFPPVTDPRPAFHRVKAGETLYAISVRYGVTVDQLRKWNRIRKNHIEVGQRLRLQKP